MPACSSSLRSSSASMLKSRPFRSDDRIARRVPHEFVGPRELAALLLLAVLVPTGWRGRSHGRDGRRAVRHARERRHAAQTAEGTHAAAWHAWDPTAAAELAHERLHLAELVQQLVDLGRGRARAARD